jgi:hypothetical protein
VIEPPLVTDPLLQSLGDAAHFAKLPVPLVPSALVLLLLPPDPLPHAALASATTAIPAASDLAL